MDVLRISCDSCVVVTEGWEDRSICADCMVTFLCSRDADDAVVVDLAEFSALQRLARAGLVPEVRHRRSHIG